MDSQSDETFEGSADIRAARVKRDFLRAIARYSLGDRSEGVQQDLAVGARCFRAAGWPIPVPWGMSPDLWLRLLDGLVDFGSR